DDVIIQDGKITIHHIDWERPTNIVINGRKWTPAWSENNDTDAFTKFSPTLAPFDGTPATVKKNTGRGEVTIHEQPTAANGQKLVVRLRDAGSGASDFDVVITWGAHEP
ncbi:MAG: hypothetical protein QOD99_2184, partial [Chthoniobacter sp.]|nr:hypothetical protein [Chthoniobacter sp.]